MFDQTQDATDSSDNSEETTANGHAKLAKDDSDINAKTNDFIHVEESEGARRIRDLGGDKTLKVMVGSSEGFGGLNGRPSSTPDST